MTRYKRRMVTRRDSPIRARARRATAAALGAALLAATGAAQSRAEAIAKVADPWLAGDQSSRERLDAVVVVLLQEPTSGIAWLADKLAAARTQPDGKGVQQLVAHTSLEFLRRQRATDLTFVGQYAPLAPLQPEVGEFLFGLLLEPPEWYPTTHRVHLVAPLRDLQPTPPEPARIDAIAQIAENERLEPEDLRRALAAMLHQWGRKEPARTLLAQLVAATAEGDGEDRVQTTLALADFHVLLRDYKQAAAAHRSAQTLAKTAGVQLKPVAFYAAACVHALVGDVERGLAALGACVDLLASPHLDSSLRLPRAMFDKDPELAPLRARPEWAALMQRAFPPAGADQPRGR